MNTRQKNVLFVVAISIIMAILRTIIVSTNLEKNIRNEDIYYLPANFIVISFTVAGGILLLAFLFSALKFGKKPIVFDDASTASSIGSLIASFCLIGTTVAYFFLLAADNKPPEYFANGMRDRAFGNFQQISMLETFVAAFAVASALKFLLIGIRNHKTQKLSSSSVAILSLFPIIFSALRLLSDFITTSAIPFASSNVYHMLSLIATLLFFLVEGKSYVLKSKAFLPDFYGYVAIFMISVFAIPNLVIHCFGTLTFDVDSAFSIADLGIAVYIITKLYTSKKADAE